VAYFYPLILLYSKGSLLQLPTGYYTFICMSCAHTFKSLIITATFLGIVVQVSIHCFLLHVCIYYVNFESPYYGVIRDCSSSGSRKVLREVASGGRDAERVKLKLEIVVEVMHHLSVPSFFLHDSIYYPLTCQLTAIIVGCQVSQLCGVVG